LTIDKPYYAIMLLCIVWQKVSMEVS